MIKSVKIQCTTFRLSSGGSKRCMLTNFGLINLISEEQGSLRQSLILSGLQADHSRVGFNSPFAVPPKKCENPSPPFRLITLATRPHAPASHLVGPKKESLYYTHAAPGNITYGRQAAASSGFVRVPTRHSANNQR